MSEYTIYRTSKKYFEVDENSSMADVLSGAQVFKQYQTKETAENFIYEVSEKHPSTVYMLVETKWLNRFCYDEPIDFIGAYNDGIQIW